MLKNTTDEILVPEKVNKKFEDIHRFPLVSLETPLGYGKTTLLKRYLTVSGTMHLWITVKADSCELFWEHFCGALKSVDYSSAGELERAGFPSDEADMVRRVNGIKEIGFEHDVVIVIDDYHNITDRRTGIFFEMLARENIRKFHTVLSGRKRFNNNREELAVKGLLLVIEEQDFMLSEDECREYFFMRGIRLTPRQVFDLHRLTEGWVTAVKMVMECYADSRRIEMPPMSIEMFENSVYSGLNEDERDFLLRVCLFEHFTMEQARFIRRKHDPSEILRNIVSSKGFIRYDARTGRYHLHRMYAFFLRNILEKKELKYKSEVFRHAADWHYLNRKFGRAAYEYYRSGNFEDMLKTFELDGGKALAPKSYRRLKEAFTLCPGHIRRRHPTAMMIYARQLWMMGDMRAYAENMELLENIISDSSYTDREKKNLEGDLNFLKSITSLNDLNRTMEYQKAAAGLLRRAAAVQDKSCLFSYGAPSIFYLYHRDAGDADNLKKILTESRDVYYKLTDNNGRGAEYQLEAELCYLRTDFYRAEILSYKAYNTAQKYGQTDIMICALHLQMKVFSMRGDSKKTVDALKQIKELAKNSGLRVYSHMADLCETGLYTMYNELDAVESWIMEEPSENEGVYRPARGYLCMVYGKLLIEKGEYTKYLGMSDGLRDVAGENKMLLPLIYFDICDSIAFRQTGMEEESFRASMNAVKKAEPDNIIMPFVENGRNVLEMLENMKLRGERSQFIENCLYFARKCEKYLGVRLITDSTSPMSLLTKREQEISLLVADGKTNKEIAKTLNIAEITVKKSLSNVYARLGVSNRTSLLKKLDKR